MTLPFPAEVETHLDDYISQLLDRAPAGAAAREAAAAAIKRMVRSALRDESVFYDQISDGKCRSEDWYIDYYDPDDAVVDI